VKIIGVVSNSAYRDIRDEAPRVLYLSFAQEADPTRERTIFLSNDVDSGRSIDLLRGAVRELDRNLPVYDIKTFAEQKAESLASNRLVATLSTFFGALALLLAGIGLYGVLAYEVNQRTIEIGIRMSLGASRAHVLWMVIRRTLLMVGGGVVLAVPLGRFCFSLISTLLFHVSPNNPLLFTASCCVLTVVALLAAASPALRAARIDPLRAIREN
jgi:ABC-type antimicrobial peptide transport system permease subunit